MLALNELSGSDEGEAQVTSAPVWVLLMLPQVGRGEVLVVEDGLVVHSCAPCPPGGFLNASSLLQGVQALLGELQATLTSRPQLLSLKAPSLACFPGYRLDLSGAGCRECRSSGGR